MTDLGTLRGGHLSNAQAINKHGLIAGFSDIPSLAFRPVVWARGVISLLDLLPDTDFAQVWGINDHGAGVGRSGQRPALWARDAVIDLGTLPGATEAIGFAINDRGVVVGQGATAAGEAHAVMWTR